MHRQLALVLFTLVGAGLAAGQPVPPPKEAPVSTPKIEAVKKQLSVEVAKGFNNPKIDTRTETGPLGFTIVVAAVQGAYPGSGVARVLIDNRGVTYGVHGEKDFADLSRERKWLGDGALPDAATLHKLVDLAFFDGVAIWLDKPAPKVERAPDHLTITAYRTWHPSGGKTRVSVTVRATGKAEVASVNE